MPNYNKSRVAAAVLAFFFGGFGVHKFYMGKPQQGILYALFFWTMIPAFIALVESITYIAMDDKTWHDQYGV